MSFSESAQAALELGLIDTTDIQFIDRLVPIAETNQPDLLGETLLGLAKAFQQGSVRMPLEDSQWTDFKNAWGQGQYHRVIGIPGEYKPIILDDNALYSHQSISHEIDIAKRLRTFQSVSQTAELKSDSNQTEQALHEILIQHPLTNAKGEPLDFSGSRENALRQSLQSRLLVISGEPGTGKTSLCTNLLRLHRRLFGDTYRIALTAPTGRAAQRMVESIRSASVRELDALEATTLHRLLGYEVGRDIFRYQENLTLPFDLVVVDESSMMDMRLFRALLKALSPTAHLILLGDRDQLPSVAAGSLLVDLGPESGQPDSQAPVAWATLTGSHRSHPALVQAAEKWLLGSFSHFGNDNSDAIAGQQNSRSIPAPITFKNILRDQDKANWESEVMAWFHAHSPDEKLLQVLPSIETPEDANRQGHFRWQADDSRYSLVRPLFEFHSRSQILTLLRQGPEGVSGLNAMARKWFQPQWDALSFASGAAKPNDWLSSRYFHGAPILVERNDFARDLSNGDRGIVLRFAGKLWGTFISPHHIDFWPLAVLPNIDLAFAATVHKCQGSEFEEIFLVLPSPEHPLLSREVVYTALTRARQSVTLLGSQDALAFAAQKYLLRSSGLKKRLVG